MNDDLISRSTLKEAIREWRYHGYYDKLIEVINNAPTVDTTCPNCDSGYAQGYSDGYLKGKEARPQGEWIEDIENLLYRCSNCNASSNIRMFKSNLHFCPNCGADMRGGRA